MKAERWTESFHDYFHVQRSSFRVRVEDMGLCLSDMVQRMLLMMRMDKQGHIIF